MHDDTHRDEYHVRYIHACLGNPIPTTNAKNGSQEYADSEDTAKGHLNKTPTKQPHAASNPSMLNDGFSSKHSNNKTN
jgi:hypothetical protein